VLRIELLCTQDNCKGTVVLYVAGFLDGRIYKYCGDDLPSGPMRVMGTVSLGSFAVAGTGIFCATLVG
jgi:hypothetical protein